MPALLSRMPAVMIVLSLLASPAIAFDDKDHRLAQDSVRKAIAYLRTTQNQDGSWSSQYGPAITGLVVTAMLDQPDISPSDPHVRRAIAYLLSQVKEDGSIHSGMLENYNTAICLSALSRVRNDPQIARVLQQGEKYLRSLQYVEGTKDPHGNPITREHAYWGGFGYGNRGRPDGNNTQFALQAFRDMGVDCEDPVFKEAIVYTSRLQGHRETNDMFKGDEIVQNGGFIYATSVNKDLIGVPQSPASPELEKAAAEGKPVRNVQPYASMTYAALKSFVYAELDREDPRVRAAVAWIQQHYTVQHNMGMPEDMRFVGYHYQLMTLARAMNAWNADVRDDKDKPIEWRKDLTHRLVKLQAEDGHWVNKTQSYVEGDSNLVTAYSIIALNNVLGRER